MPLNHHCHPTADGRGRERQREPTSTLEVPEQQRTPAHHIRSRSVSPHREEQGRIWSRPPNVPTQRWGLQVCTRFGNILNFDMNKAVVHSLFIIIIQAFWGKRRVYWKWCTQIFWVWNAMVNFMVVAVNSRKVYTEEKLSKWPKELFSALESQLIPVTW